MDFQEIIAEIRKLSLVEVDEVVDFVHKLYDERTAASLEDGKPTDFAGN